MKNILSVLFVIGAFALFFLYSNPTYENTASLKTKIANYDEALANATELQKIRDEQTVKYEKILTTQQQDLEKLVPDNVDNIKLIIDISRIATRFGLEMKGIKVDQLQTDTKTAAGQPGISNAQGLGSINLSFSVTASYDRIMDFLADLEHSLRIVDITSMSFVAGKDDTYDFSMTLRTYWLK